MKSFTIRLPKQNIDNNGSIKNKILNAVANKLPFARWHGIHTPETEEESICYAGPGDLLCFGIHPTVEFSALNKTKWHTTPCNKCLSCPFANSTIPFKTYDSTTELDKALIRLQKYADFLDDYERDPGYDFMYMGLPVRVYQKFIQIGNDIILISNMSYFKKKENKPIINIIINISKSEEITNIINL